MPATEPAALPDWCTVGAKVAVGNRDVFHTTTVLRITATQVVCGDADGSRETKYRRRDLSRIGDGAWDHNRLVDPRSPQVVEYARQTRLRRVGGDVEALAMRLRRDGDLDAARQAVTLLTDLLAKES